MKIYFNGKGYSAKQGQTIIEVARKNNLYIPTLCYLKDQMQESDCNMCVVMLEGCSELVKACDTPVTDGMRVLLDTPEIIEYRKIILENLLNVHNLNCGVCAKNGSCFFQKQWIANKAKKTVFETTGEIDDSSLSILRDYNKCVFCGRCVEICSKMQHTFALQKVDTPQGVRIECNQGKLFKDSHCTGCGQCVLVCPTASLTEKSDIQRVQEFIDDPDIKVVAQIAPAVRVAFGEEFGKEYGFFDEGKLVGCTKDLGFDYVFDVNTGADFTAIEESKELVERIKNNQNLPQFTSCCPAWYRYVEEYYPEYMDNLSMCRSPNEMLASVVRECVFDKGQKVKIVAIMPCTAKKEEITIFGQVDAVLTTRELSRMVKEKDIDYEKVKPKKFDNPLARYSGGGLIFGVTGGVTESVLRCAVRMLSKNKDKTAEFETVRNSDGLKEIQANVAGQTLNVAVVNGISNAQKVIENIKQGKTYHFIEVMACPGGCIGGGGQPIVDRDRVDYDMVLRKRAQALYNKDKVLKYRSAITNPDVLKIYKNFLEPSPNKIEELLHRTKPNKKD